MKLHREGTASILLIIMLSIVLGFVFWTFIPFQIVNGLLSLVLLVLIFLIVWFFRVPSRTQKYDPFTIYAPADGKVVVIEKTKENEFFKDERIQVSIFMSPLNVHSNSYPISGEVSYTKYHKGKYLVAWHPKSSTDNERSTVVVKTKDGIEILFRQIAGALARRICNYAKTGDKAIVGQEFGFIKFGSRVDLFLPLGSEILCTLNQKCTSRITPIARFINNN